MYTTPILQRDSKFFENKKHPPKVLDTNTYPVFSIFEFISKLTNLVYSNVKDNKKVYMGFMNPMTETNKFVSSTRGSFSNNLIETIINHKKIYSCLFLLGQPLATNCSHLKNFRKKDVYLFYNNYSLARGNSILTMLLINNKVRADLFKEYMSSRLMLINSIYFSYGQHSKNEIKDLPISLNFWRNYPIKIFVKNISENSVFITWGYEYKSDGLLKKSDADYIKKIESLQETNTKRDICNEEINDFDDQITITDTLTEVRTTLD